MLALKGNPFSIEMKAVMRTAPEFRTE